MKTLFYSYNLLGDSLQTTPAIRAYYEKAKDAEITVATHDNWISIVYERIGIPVTVFKEDKSLLKESEYDFVFNFDISKAFSLGTSGNFCACGVFGLMLGLQLERLYPFYENPLGDDLNQMSSKWDAYPGALNYIRSYGMVVKDHYILFQPYSVSCSSWTGEPANKRWYDESWKNIYDWLKRDYSQYRVVVLGGPKDYVIDGIPEENHYFNLPLDVVAVLQKHSRMILSLDSGVAHLAASQEARMLELYPECLPNEWMSNMASPNVRIIHARPQDLPADWVYAQLVDYLKATESKS